MRTIALIFATAMLLSAAVLISKPAEALISGPSSGIQTAVKSADAIEKAACYRRRVCGARGCAWRTICRR
jgi:hypothetical protein